MFDHKQAVARRVTEALRSLPREYFIEMSDSSLVLGRSIPDKHAFRSTVATLFLLLAVLIEVDPSRRYTRTSVASFTRSRRRVSSATQRRARSLPSARCTRIWPRSRP